jgi:exosortase A-associated hydrolase 2
MASGEFTVNPRLLGEPGARVYGIDYQPSAATKGRVLFLPPFGEEMNRCRATVAEQARAFARGGYHCLVMDFVGTGESEAQLEDVALAHWYRDIDLAVAALGDEGQGPLVIWGLRLGALLALEYLSLSSTSCQQLLLWEPVPAGKRFVTQLLRQRVAMLVSQDLPAQTTAEIRQALTDGDKVELSGYPVRDPLIRDIEGLAVTTLQHSPAPQVIWMEHNQDPEPAQKPAMAKAVAHLHELGCEVTVHFFGDPPQWQLHKRDEAPELLTLTARAMSL